jgi:hypothetical protein
MYFDVVIKDLAGNTLGNCATRCRDTAFHDLRKHYARQDGAIGVLVSMPHVSNEAIDAICGFLSQLPQYKDMTFTRVDDLVGYFAVRKTALKITGPEILHAFYWATLFLRIAATTHNEWSSLDQLLKHMRAGTSIDRGYAREHRAAWERVKQNADISSADMLRYNSGPIGAYVLREHYRQ